MTPYRILVTGSRKWTDAHAVDRELGAIARRIVQEGQDVVLVHGAATGLDTIAADEATHRGWTVEPHPAEEHGSWPYCGPLRNQAMVDLGADLCLAFPTADSRGTWDCVKRANKAGIRVIIVPEKKP